MLTFHDILCKLHYISWNCSGTQVTVRCTIQTNKSVHNLRGVHIKGFHCIIIIVIKFSGICLMLR